MSEIKTVTHEGNVYQIGGIYEFSDDGVYWTIDTLALISAGDNLLFSATRCKWRLLRETKSKIGTITPAPVELVDGAAYTFDVRGRNRHHAGIYDERQGIFSISQGQWVDLESATNIRLMTVGSE